MAPVTRSSAPTTPVKTNAHSCSPSPGRKTPHCTKCHLPRKGHPRQGCPSLNEHSSGTRVVSAPDIIQAMGSMNITLNVSGHPLQPQPIGHDKVTRPSRDPTLTGMPTSDGSGRNLGSTGQAFTKAAFRRQYGLLMPGTLVPPSDSFLESNPPTPPNSQTTEVVSFTRNRDMDCSKPLSEQNDFPVQPLARSASIEARECFLADLDRMAMRAPVSVYIVPIEDLPVLETAANKVGFRTSAVVPKPETKETKALLIIGVDEIAVELLRIRLERNADAQQNTGHTALMTMASSAAAGAALLYTGLAFTPDS